MGSILKYSESDLVTFAAPVLYRQAEETPDSTMIWKWVEKFITVTNRGFLLLFHNEEVFADILRRGQSLNDPSIDYFLRYRLGYHEMLPKPEEYGNLLAFELHVGPRRTLILRAHDVWCFSGLRAGISAHIIGNSREENAALKMQRAVRGWLARLALVKTMTEVEPPDYVEIDDEGQLPPIYEESDHNASEILPVDDTNEDLKLEKGLFVKSFHCYSANRDTVFEPDEDIFVDNVVVFNDSNEDSHAGRILYFPSSEIIISNEEKITLPMIKAKSSFVVKSTFSGRVIDIHDMDLPGQYCLIGSFSPVIKEGFATGTASPFEVGGTGVHRSFDITVQYPIRIEQILFQSVASPGDILKFKVEIRNISTATYGDPCPPSVEGPLSVVLDFLPLIKPLESSLPKSAKCTQDHEAISIVFPVLEMTGESTKSFEFEAEVNSGAALYELSRFTVSIILRKKKIEFHDHDIRIVPQYQFFRNDDSPKVAGDFLLVTNNKYLTPVHALWNGALEVMGISYDTWDVEKRGFSCNEDMERLPGDWRDRYQKGAIIFPTCDQNTLTQVHPIDLLAQFKSTDKPHERRLVGYDEGSKLPMLPLDETDSVTLKHCDDLSFGGGMFFFDTEDEGIANIIKEKLSSILPPGKDGMPQHPLNLSSARLYVGATNVALSTYVNHVFKLVHATGDTWDAKLMTSNLLPICSLAAQVLLFIVNVCSVNRKIGFLVRDKVAKVNFVFPNQRMYSLNSIIALSIYNDIKDDRDGFYASAFLEGIHTFSTMLPEKVLFHNNVCSLLWETFVKASRKNEYLASKFLMAEKLIFSNINKREEIENIKKDVGSVNPPDPLRLKYHYLWWKNLRVM